MEDTSANVHLLEWMSAVTKTEFCTEEKIRLKIARAFTSKNS